MVASPTRYSTNGGQLDLYNGHCSIHPCTPVRYCCPHGIIVGTVPGGRRGGEGASSQSRVDVVVAGTAVQVSQ